MEYLVLRGRKQRRFSAGYLARDVSELELDVSSLFAMLTYRSGNERRRRRRRENKSSPLKRYPSNYDFYETLSIYNGMIPSTHCEMVASVEEVK